MDEMREFSHDGDAAIALSMEVGRAIEALSVLV
jgi:hypothetical protein